MRLFVYVLFLLLLSENIVFAQDTLVLTNGKLKYPVEISGKDNRYIFYKKQNSQKKISRSLVFALKSAKGTEIITYVRDNNDVEISTLDMYEYLQGLVDARNGHACNGFFVSGFVISTLSGTFLPTALTPVIPVLYPGLIGIYKPDVTHFSNFPVTKKNNFYYIKGYEYGVKSMTLRKAGTGSLLGFGTGILISTFLLK